MKKPFSKRTQRSVDVYETTGAFKIHSIHISLPKVNFPIVREVSITTVMVEKATE